jgi:hypothetical protein
VTTPWNELGLSEAPAVALLERSGSSIRKVNDRNCASAARGFTCAHRRSASPAEGAAALREIAERGVGRVRDAVEVETSAIDEQIRGQHPTRGVANSEPLDDGSVVDRCADRRICVAPRLLEMALVAEFPTR